MPSVVEPTESVVCEAQTEMPKEKKAKIETSDVSTDAPTDVVSDATSVAASTDIGTDAPTEVSAVSSASPAAAVGDKVLRETLRFAKLSANAKAPTRGSALAAGFDLYAAEEKVIEPGERKLVKTDIQIDVPSGTYGRVAPRSGLAWKHGIDVGAGVIDKDYRGNVGVLLFNFGKETFSVSPGDRIAQLVLEKICMAELEELPTLDDTARGEGGFGSTGKA